MEKWCTFLPKISMSQEIVHTHTHCKYTSKKKAIVFATPIEIHPIRVNSSCYWSANVYCQTVWKFYASKVMGTKLNSPKQAILHEYPFCISQQKHIHLRSEYSNFFHIRKYTKNCWKNSNFQYFYIWKVNLQMNETISINVSRAIHYRL